MVAQKYLIDFDGYWREPYKDGIPGRSGIYCVYSCTFNKLSRKVSLKYLIYIGESENVRARIANHEKQRDWEKHLGQGEELCYSFSGVSRASRERCEAAMIFINKPLENTEYLESFPFDQTSMTLSGTTALLCQSFDIMDILVAQ